MAFSRLATKGQSALVCQLCENEPKIKWKCMECALMMCQRCLDKVHPKFPSSKNHTTIDIKDVGKQQIDSGDNLDFTNLKCCSHVGQRCCLFCESCDVLVCPSCITNAHKKHELIDINVGYKTTVAKIKARKEHFEKEVQTLLKQEEEFRKIKYQCQVSMNGTKQEITDYEKAVVTAVKKYTHKLLQKVSDEGMNLVTMVTTEENEVIEIRKTLTKQMAEVTDLLHSSNIEKVFAISKAFLNLDIVTTKPTSKFKPPSKFVPGKTANILSTFGRLNSFPAEHFAKDDELSVERSITTKFKEITNIIVCKDDSLWLNDYHSEIHHPKQNEALQDESVTFLGVLCNYVGKPMKEDVSHLKAIVTDPTGLTFDARVFQNGSEGFRVTFVPFHAGAYKLEVSILDKQLGCHDFQVKPRDKPQGSKIDAGQLDGATRPEFGFERKKAHKDVTVTPDGKTFVNSPTGTLMVSTKDRLHKFKGTYGNQPFKTPGKFYYEINVRYKIRNQLEKSNLVFEIGLTRQKEMDKKHVVDGQSHAWSMICSQHVDCDAICLHIVHIGKCLFHETLSKNDIGSSMDKTFGYLLDTTRGVWRIFDATKNKSICQMDDIDCSEDLVPVVSGYNPDQVEVTMTLCTGDEE